MDKLHALSLAASPRKLAILRSKGACVLLAHRATAVALFAHIRLATPLHKTSLLLITCCDTAGHGVLSLHTLLLGGDTRVTVATQLDGSLDTIAPLYANASWYEREACEMFGVRLCGSDDTRGLLLAYGASAHPLKKSVPTATRGLLQSSRASESLRWFTL